MPCKRAWKRIEEAIAEEEQAQADLLLLEHGETPAPAPPTAEPAIEEGSTSGGANVEQSVVGELPSGLAVGQMVSLPTLKDLPKGQRETGPPVPKPIPVMGGGPHQHVVPHLKHEGAIDQTGHHHADATLSSRKTDDGLTPRLPSRNNQSGRASSLSPSASGYSLEELSHSFAKTSSLQRAVTGLHKLKSNIKGVEAKVEDSGLVRSISKFGMVRAAAVTYL